MHKFFVSVSAAVVACSACTRVEPPSIPEREIEALLGVPADTCGTTAEPRRLHLEAWIEDGRLVIASDDLADVDEVPVLVSIVGGAGSRSYLDRLERGIGEIAMPEAAPARVGSCTSTTWISVRVVGEDEGGVTLTIPCQEDAVVERREDDEGAVLFIGGAASLGSRPYSPDERDAEPDPEAPRRSKEETR